MDQDETWHAGRPQPWPHGVRWGPSSPSPKGAQQPPPTFRSMSIVAKQSPMSATAELLIVLEITDNISQMGNGTRYKHS